MMMGHSGTVPGAIPAEDVPSALSSLTAAIDEVKVLTPIRDSDKPVVSMANRALPLIALLAAAAKAGAGVTWK